MAVTWLKWTQTSKETYLKRSKINRSQRYVQDCWRDLEGSRRQKGHQRLADLQRQRLPASLGSISSNLDWHVWPNSCLCTTSKILRDENIRHYLLSLGEGKDSLNSEWGRSILSDIKQLPRYIIKHFKNESFRMTCILCHLYITHREYMYAYMVVLDSRRIH